MQKDRRLGTPYGLWTFCYMLLVSRQRAAEQVKRQKHEVLAATHKVRVGIKASGVNAVKNLRGPHRCVR